MDNLPNDPSNPNNGNNNNPPASPDGSQGGPPPFGSGFAPHTNPIDPNNSYQAQPPQQPAPPVPNLPNTLNTPLSSEALAKEDENPDALKHEHYSEAAQNKPRDEHGHFKSNSSQAPLIHTNPDPQTPPTSPNPPNPSLPSEASTKSGFLPPIIEINQNTKPTEKEDPPLFGFFLTNPVTYLKKFLSRLLKRQMITLRIPVLALLIIMVGLGGFGVGFKSGSNYILGKLFPNFSPILGRSITAQGIILKSSKGYYLQANDKDKTMWTLNPVTSNINLKDYENQKVEIKGKMTPTPYLIEVLEITSFEPKPTSAPAVPSQTSPITPNTPNSPNLPDSSALPALFSGLTWEVTKSKTLIFTSGLRKIEQEGVYFESAQVLNFPQDFINYYTNQLTNSGFKQTLNSSEPTGTTITYAKDDLFLTFGAKNIYTGSGENRKLTGYKAFIEHN